jgi:lipoprotein LprG
VPRPRALLTFLAALLLVAPAACSSGKRKPAESLPAGDQLLKAAATAMRDVKTAHFTIETDGNLALLPLRRADAKLTREGSAQGTVQIDQSGSTVEFAFVIIGDTAYIKGPTGGYQTVPLSFAASVYDPSAILDPGRGVAHLLETATDARTQGHEKVDGVDAYVIAAKFDPKAVETLVPGAGAGVTGQLWLGVEQKLPVRAKFQLPDRSGGKPATVTVKFTEYDQPVNISAP